MVLTRTTQRHFTNTTLITFAQQRDKYTAIYRIYNLILRMNK